MNTSERKRALRSALRQERRQWTGFERASAEDMICDAIRHRPEIMHARWIGAYLAFDGEVDLSGLWGGGHPIIDAPDDEYERSLLPNALNQVTSHPAQLPLRSKLIFPRHRRDEPLSFVRPLRWVGDKALLLPEGPTISLTDINVLLIPGVAFSSAHGSRLGLGGGHYDRTLALRVNLSWSVKAFGVGFCFQQRPQLPLEPWDAPLDGVFTERGLLEPINPYAEPTE